MKPKTLILSFLSLIFHNGQAFTQPAFTRMHGSIKNNNNVLSSSNHQGKRRARGSNIAVNNQLPHSSSTRSTSLQMIDIILPFSMVDISIGTPFDSLDTTSANPILLSSSQENFESRFFGDMAHLILDFATIWSPDTVLLRLLIFLGRICAILSDYVPDHSIMGDEFVFQFTMLAISTDMFLKKFHTTVSSLTKDTSFQDRRIFKSIFNPAGFSFTQYRSLLSSNVLEWVDCNPDHLIFEDESSILITYKGSVQQHQSINITTDTSSLGNLDISTYYACQGNYCYEIIGNIPQAYETLESRRRKQTSSPSSKALAVEVQQIDLSRDNIKHQVLRVGPMGATLLRINTKTLLEKVGEDSDITESIKNLYFNAMQSKLSSYADTTDLFLGNNQVNKTVSQQFV